MINFFIWNTSDRYGVNTQNKHQHSLREISDSKVLVIIKISGRLPTFLKATTLFYQSSLFMSKIRTPLFFEGARDFENLNPPL